MNSKNSKVNISSVYTYNRILKQSIAFFIVFAFAISCMAFCFGFAQLTNPLGESILESDLEIHLEEFVQLPQVDSGYRGINARISHLKPMGANSERLMVNNQTGFLYIVEEDNWLEYMDFGKEIGENFVSTGKLGTGLHAFAFHPEFAENGKFYTTHTEEAYAAPADFTVADSGADDRLELAQQTILTEWKANTPSANSFSGTQKELFRIDMPYTIHTLQDLTFNASAEVDGEDYGLLYVGMGDGGVSNSNVYRPDLTHRLDSVYGSILRIDPAGSNSANGQYGIPESNPWADDDDPNTLGEIYAYGFRNPHRLSFDQNGTGMFLVGEYGEKNLEEVNLVLAGHDYGWIQREGTFLYKSPPKGVSNEVVYPLPENDADFDYTYPVAQFDHTGLTGIVGGYVSRNLETPNHYGKYFFGDKRVGRVFFIHVEDIVLGEQAPIYEATLFVDGEQTTLKKLAGLRESSNDRVDLHFGYDNDGSIYILEKRLGKVYKVIPNSIDLKE